MASVEITGKVLGWARERAGLSEERLAKTVHTKPEKIRAWENEDEFPSFRQAQKLATVLSVPLGYLVLEEPPDIVLPVADFRTFGNQTQGDLSPNLQEVLDDALRKRDWFAEWRQGEGYSALDFVGKFAVGDDEQALIQDMRQVLNVDAGFASGFPSWEDHLRELIIKVELAGILVLQNGIVGNNTRRKLSVDEFRGFALAHEVAPLVFINASDVVAAKIFTLVHELVHIWTGTSGISNPELGITTNGSQVEQYCNKIAGEFLVPANLLSSRWNSWISPTENAQQLARYFRVSAQAILVRSRTEGIVSVEDFTKAFSAVIKAAKPKKASTGGQFYRSLFTRNSRRFTSELLSAVAGGHITYVNAARLLNTQPGKVANALTRLTSGE